MKSAFDLWIDEIMDQPVRQLIEADRLDFKIIIDFIRTRRRAKADLDRNEKRRGKHE